MKHRAVVEFICINPGITLVNKVSPKYSPGKSNTPVKMTKIPQNNFTVIKLIHYTGYYYRAGKKN